MRISRCRCFATRTGLGCQDAAGCGYHRHADADSSAHRGTGADRQIAGRCTQNHVFRLTQNIVPSSINTGLP
jgi:hypothetical protein